MKHIVLNLYNRHSDAHLETYIFPVPEGKEEEAHIHAQIGTAYTEARKKENYGIEHFEEELDKRDIEYEKPFHLINWDW